MCARRLKIRRQNADIHLMPSLTNMHLPYGIDYRRHMATRFSLLLLALACALAWPQVARAYVWPASDAKAQNSWYVEPLGLPQAWTAGYTGQGVTVAVIDSGLDIYHPDVDQSRIWQNSNEQGALRSNDVDDDCNGYVDDANGWSFLDDEVLLVADNPALVPVGCDLTEVHRIRADEIRDHSASVGPATLDTIISEQDGSSHGTAVATVLLARYGNSPTGCWPYPGVNAGDYAAGVCGADHLQMDHVYADGVPAAPDVTVMVIRGSDYPSIRYAIDNGADIITLSRTIGGSQEAIYETLDYADAHGVPVFCAAGNSAFDAFPEVIGHKCIVVNQALPDSFTSTPGSVLGFVGSQNDLTGPSAYFDHVPYANAPGMFAFDSGTSLATPAVAAVAALICEKRGASCAGASANDPGTDEAILSALASTATDVNLPGKDIYTGYGIVNAARALGLSGPPGLSCSAPSPMILPGQTVKIPISCPYTSSRTWCMPQSALQPGVGLEPSAFSPCIDNLGWYNPSKLWYSYYLQRVASPNIGSLTIKDPSDPANDGSVTYTAPASEGTATFKLYAHDAASSSPVLTVRVTIQKRTLTAKLRFTDAKGKIRRCGAATRPCAAKAYTYSYARVEAGPVALAAGRAVKIQRQRVKTRAMSAQKVTLGSRGIRLTRRKLGAASGLWRARVVIAATATTKAAVSPWRYYRIS
jgi:subtilisin family serine protease